MALWSFKYCESSLTWTTNQRSMLNHKGDEKCDVIPWSVHDYATGWTFYDSDSLWATDFLLLRHFKTGSGVHPDSHSIVYQCSHSESEVDHSSSSSAEVKNKWSYTSAFPTFLHDVDREKLNCTFDVTTAWNKFHFWAYHRVASRYKCNWDLNFMFRLLCIVINSCTKTNWVH